MRATWMAALLCWASAVAGQELDLRLTTIIPGFAPVDITHAGDNSGRLFLLDKRGLVRIWDGQQLIEQPFLDISAQVASAGEQGLLGLAFAPDYPSSGRFYLDYTDTSGATRIVRYSVSADDPNRADPESAQLLLRVEQPFSNHNGGQIAFGPDGMLYIALGDGGSAFDPQGNGQDLSTLLGSILRIDVSGADYSIPPDNPFVGQDGARDEIWAYGLRNPWRFAFDRDNGDLYIADVGQAQREEVNVIPGGSAGGQNFGWVITEGDICVVAGCDRSGLVDPVFAYQQDGARAVIGGRVYRGSSYPRMRGIFFFNDFFSGNLWGVRRDGAGGYQTTLHLPSASAAALPVGVRAFGEDQAGNIYLVTPRGVELLSDGPPVSGSLPISPGFTGAWFDPDQAGHGLFIEVLPPAEGGTRPRLLAWWFTFTPDGEQAWFGGTGEIDGDRAVIEVVQTFGGRWIPNFDPDNVVNQSWGSFVIRFDSCTSGTVEFSADIGGFASGSMRLTRLTQPAALSCP